MSNPAIATGNVTREAGKKVEKFRLVKSVSGKIEHAGASDMPFGAVTESAAPKKAPGANDLSHGLPSHVRVHTGLVVVPVAASGSGFTVDGTVYAAEDGKVASSGSVAVGLAAEAVKGGLVKVALFHPAGLA